ncbi:MAG TPA: ABC transporter permease [Bacteroidales bacterium]|nr:ABC transporter permease [Bacteroidales bacterium]
MNLPIFIARRYLFSKKSHNAINVISLVSVCGIAVATMAMIVALSVFNGFGDLVETTFSAFDPELKITTVKGKVFDYHTDDFAKVLQNPHIDFISESLEDNVLFRYNDRQVPVILKGVSEDFKYMTQMDKLIIDGSFRLREDVVDYATLGSGLAYTLGVRPGYIAPIDIFVPKRNVAVNMANPSAAFAQSYVQIGGVFNLNQPDFDEQMAIVPIELARDLFRYSNEVTSIDVKLKEGASVKRVRQSIAQNIGDDYLVEDRFEQQKESYRMLQIEKWVTFLILSFILIIAAFNVVGPLSILIIEKKNDIKILKSMGAADEIIAQIFLFEGWLISFSGIIVGVVLGVGISFLQQQFGLLKLGGTPGAYLVDAYPVIVKLSDVLLTFIIVCLICVSAIIYPIHNLKKQLTAKTFN